MNDFDTFTKINVGDLGKIIVDTSFEWLPKVQKIAKSGHTVSVFHDLYEPNVSARKIVIKITF